MDMTPREPVVVNGFANEPPSSIVTVAKIVYILHAVSVIIGIVTGASVIGAFLFGWRFKLRDAQRSPRHVC